MRTNIVVLTLALVLPLLAGCVDKGTDEGLAATRQSAEDGNATGTPEATGGNVAPKPTRVPLDAKAAVSQPWVKPGEAVTLTAQSAKATKFEWYLQQRATPAPTAAPAAGGGHHLALGEASPALAAMGPGHEEAAPPPKPQPKFDTGNIEPGAKSKILLVKEEGLYRFHCHPHPWMKFNLTVKAGAPTTDQTVTILDGKSQGEYRYAPEELVVGPGTKVQFANKGQQMHTATQEAYLEIIPGEGKSVTYKPAASGDYDVVLLARDEASGLGEARVRLLVDAAKPDEQQPIGPFTGEFQKGVPNLPEQESKTFDFTSPYNFKTLKLDITATSETPVPPSVRISLAPEGGEALLASEPGASGSLSFENLPAGKYVLTVTAEQGVLISYEVAGEALLDVVLTEGSAPAAGGEHAGH